ncbi:MAG: hypothetical protein J07HX5_00843 [halophilic archaeon J07HX5]|nr:MAG: hypothetical protein J07HX5_00843 [halophilic archaeon J07HX5]
MPAHSDGLPNTTLFSGLGGLAWTALWLCEPAELPCVLLLE